jgi:type VI secretion system protein ImpJ
MVKRLETTLQFIKLKSRNKMHEKTHKNLNTTEKVLWTEGLILGQQNFQQWDYTIEENFRFLRRDQSEYAWGVSVLEIDEVFLLNGKFNVTQLEVQLQTGERLLYEDYNSPLSCDLSGSQKKKVDVYLCVPNNEEAKGISGYQVKTDNAKWHAKYIMVEDHYRQENARELLVGSKNLFLCTGEEDRTELYSIKIAECERVNEGTYQLTDYIPPLKIVSVSPVLLASLNKLKNNLIFYENYLKKYLRDYSEDNIIDVMRAMASLIEIGKMHSILRMSVASKKRSPWQLFSMLKTHLIGLQSLDWDETDIKEEELNEYDHLNINESMQQFAQKINQVIEKIKPKKVARISINRIEDDIYYVEAVEKNLLMNSAIYLGIKTNRMEPKVLINHCKLGAADGIARLIFHAIPGVTLHSCQQLPFLHSVKAGYHYFSLLPRGEIWKEIINSRSLGVFISEECQVEEVEFIAIREKI